jgi:hypothetical protein
MMQGITGKGTVAERPLLIVLAIQLLLTGVAANSQMRLRSSRHLDGHLYM